MVMKRKNLLIVSSIILLTAFILAISTLYFSTIDNSIDSNSIYYIFSTGAQTLAALVGFVLTVYIFSHQNFRNIISDDESLEEIIGDNIKKYYKLIVFLSAYTAIVLIADLLMLQLNKVSDWLYKEVLFTLIALLNVFGIIIAFSIGLYILRPFNPSKWAKEIYDRQDEVKKQKNPESFETQDINGTTIKAGDFIEEFIKFEKMIVKYTNDKYGMNSYRRSTLKNRLEMLLINRLVTENVFKELLNIIKLRNLVVHGEVNIIDKNVYDHLIKINKELEKDLK